MTLTNIKRDWNAATLYCRVTVNVSVSIVGSTTINVQYGPSTATISVSSPMKLTENTSPPTAITCSSPVCNPSCNAKWINGSTQIHNNTLFITPVSRYLAGSYKCNVSNSVGFWTKQLEIIVNYAPDVTLNWDESSKKLTCTVAGNPDNYTFHALEHRILGSTIRNISFQPGSGRSRYALLSYQDKGSYTCTVENGILKNGATKQSRTLEVVIKDVPVLLEHTRTYNVSKGDPLIVTIPIYAFPAVSKTGIMIKIGDRTMSTSDNITFNIKHHTGFVVFHNKSIESIQTLSLVINATQEEYFRNFTVNFTNSVGTTTAYFEIIPQGPPEIPVRFEQQSTTYQSVSFAVESGFFNGGDQTLVIEYRRVNSNTLRVNGSEAYVGNGKNVFVAMTVGDLTQMTDYEFRVYAFNVYGQSEYSAVVQVATALNVLMVVGIAGGTAGSICLIVLVVCLKKKRDKKKQPFVPFANIPPTSAGQNSQGQAASHVYAKDSTATENIYLNTNTTELQTSMDSNRCNKVEDHSNDEEDYMNLRLRTPQSMACDMSVKNRTYDTTHLAHKSIDTELEQGSINITIAQTSTQTQFAARYEKRAIIQEEEDDYLKMDAPRKPAKHMYENTLLTPVKTKSKEMKGDEYVHYVGFYYLSFKLNSLSNYPALTPTLSTDEDDYEDTYTNRKHKTT
ncbi:hypothetical protein DPMN_096754 [Dreissena polymorpha]|uniref:Uncharacterized protein n=1 Tax=Dreissena polymorpha TaxID=45954 RepID=A0A9D4L9Z4_DREPO|nr:hypothetical protein DPMN_096754 [Dreissena polymorpha]